MFFNERDLVINLIHDGGGGGQNPPPPPPTIRVNKVKTAFKALEIRIRNN